MVRSVFLLALSTIAVLVVLSLGYTHRENNRTEALIHAAQMLGHANAAKPIFHKPVVVPPDWGRARELCRQHGGPTGVYYPVFIAHEWEAFCTDGAAFTREGFKI